MDLWIGILSVHHRIYRARRLPRPLASITGLVKDRRRLGPRRRHVCGRLRLSDRHSAARSATNNCSRHRPFARRALGLGALHCRERTDLFILETRRLLESVAAPSDNPRLALCAASYRARWRRHFEGAIRRTCREALHIGSQRLGARFGHLGLQGARQRSPPWPPTAPRGRSARFREPRYWPGPAVTSGPGGKRAVVRE